MGLKRQIKRLMKRREEAAARKRQRKALLETLEPRLLLSADLKFTMTGAVDDVAPYLENTQGVDSALQMGNSNQALLGSQVLTDTGSVGMIFIDPRVENYEVLAEGNRNGADVFILDMN